MRAVLDPSVPVVYHEAVLWQDDQAVAHTTVKCIDDGEGGHRPAEDIRFQVHGTYAVTHVTVCGRKLTIGRGTISLEPNDTFTVEFTFTFKEIPIPFRDMDV